jgi:cobyrinic acid a,c-diamide synthase
MGGDRGKTLVSLGLVAAARRAAQVVAPFKKGPDYIDAAWLALAAGRSARNLDTFLMGDQAVCHSLIQGGQGADWALIEGNRGLFDGFDPAGSHSTSALARLVGAPVLLVLDATKVTRSLAAVVLGCQHLEPDLRVAAVVLNMVATARHERVARQAIEQATGVPVVGAIARRRGSAPLPGRHLGLVTPEEHEQAHEAVATAEEMVRQGVDLDRLWQLSRDGSEAMDDVDVAPSPAPEPTVTIGVIRDSAFSFYYPENLEALRREGARLVDISALAGTPLPEGLDGLYIGGGFPETHAALLAGNQPLFESLRRAVEEGLPVYAECGGLMLLARSLEWEGQTYPMAGVLPVEVTVQSRPCGHGYCEVRVEANNPFFSVGQRLRGHEFHYSTVAPAEVDTAYVMERGTGCFDKRDGLVYKNVLASYAHLHALGSPPWSRGMVRQASQYRRRRKAKHCLEGAD